MTSNETFGQILASWLTEDAEHRVPDHLDDVLVRTVATRQRKWWASPERWLPMDTTSNLGGRTSATRVVLIFAVLAGLIVAALGAAVLTGAFRPTAPATGPITNGRIYAADGNQLLSYAKDGKDRQVVRTLDGPTSDLRFSRDGKRLAYIVAADPRRVEILDIASGDTTNTVVPNMTDLAGPLDWSPDGKQLLFVSTDGIKEYVGLVETDGSGARIVDTSTITPTGRFGVGWSPQGDQIAFVAADPESQVGTIYVARPDGTDMHQVTDTQVVASSASWSPDPSVHRMLFTEEGNHVQFVDTSTKAVTEVNGAFWPTWSPTGDRIATWQAQVYKTSDLLLGTQRSTSLTDRWTAGSCVDHPEFKDRGYCGPLSWSPDGTRVYAPDITGTSILSVRADGNGDPIVIPLATNVVDVIDPMAWQPIVP